MWKAYFESGVLKSEGNRVNGKLDGIWTFYNEDGKISAAYSYSDGIKMVARKNFLPMVCCRPTNRF
ncbi:MAG: hypothetical protein IPP71_07275 [Bacteroidetes bacterium]|nr:hypothetical protein [Bacteroidota bacterium]